MTRSVCTVMIAPIFCSTQIRSMISGSTAALRSSVTPSARTAVSSTCSVAPTLGYGSSSLVPCSPLGAVRCMPSGVLSTIAPNWRSAWMWKSIGRGPMWQPPRSGMNACPSRCSSGPQSRIGIRLEPACTLISSVLARLHVGRVHHQLAVVGAVADLDAVQLEQAADDLDVADARDVEQPARRLAQQGGDHGLGDQVLRATDADLSVQRRSAVHNQDVFGQRNLQQAGATRPDANRGQPAGEPQLQPGQHSPE